MASTSNAKKKMSLQKKHNLIGWAFLIPASLLIFVFCFYPMFQAILLSFKKGMGAAQTWAGIANYSRILKDRTFKQCLFNTVFYFIIQVPVMLILALILVLCRKGGLVENRPLYMIVSVYINVVRSIPFVILLVTIMPITRAIVGTTIGSTAALVPLVVYISPYLARLMENSLLEIDPGILEAAEAMGATTWQVIRYFLVPETLGSMVLALTTGTIGLLGASAMAGYVGGGGVGDLALTYGYEKMNTPLMILTVVILVVLVQLLQILGNTISGKLRQHK